MNPGEVYDSDHEVRCPRSSARDQAEDQPKDRTVTNTCGTATSWSMKSTT